MKTITRTYQMSTTCHNDEVQLIPKITTEPNAVTTEEESGEVNEQGNHKSSLRKILKMLVDHFTNGKLTAYTFYY
jgi:hypothetical protein